MLRGEMYLAMDPELAAGVNTARHEAYRQMLGRGFHTDLLGVAMSKPNEAGYNRPGVYVIDAWRQKQITQIRHGFDRSSHGWREQKRRVIVARKENHMAHSLPEIEKEALRLSTEDRARLAVRLLSSLEETAASPEEVEKLWIAEAERRFQELRDGVVEGIAAQDVFTQLRNRQS